MLAGRCSIFSLVSLGLLPGNARAEVGPAVASAEQVDAAEASASRVLDIRQEVPIVGYSYAAFGSSPRTLGAQAYTLGLVAAGQDAVMGGGGAIWGSPIARLTLVVDAQRSISRNFSPSAAAIVMLLGNRDEGFSLGTLGKFKIDGFAAGPQRDEVESEIELGALLSYAGQHWHFDLNTIAGRGLGDDGETDAEGRLRLGRDLGETVRLGVDGQVRSRISGPRELPNGRSWDFAAGPQILVQRDRFFGSATVGPSTIGLLGKNIGWTAMISVGGMTF